MRFGFGQKQNPVNPKVRSHSGESAEQPTPLGQQLEALLSASEGQEDDNILLVSREDIYSDFGRGALLLKEGREISPKLLPRLIDCGAQPAQFYIRQLAEDGEWVDSEALGKVKTVRHHQHVVLLDPNQKSIQRTMQTLVACGFALGKIHPVRLNDYLSWTMEKYQPNILVMDYHLHGNITALDFLARQPFALGHKDCPLEQIIVTVPVNAVTNPNHFLAQVDHVQADILYKPVTQQALQTILR